MHQRIPNRPPCLSRGLTTAANAGLAVLSLITTAQAQVEFQDGDPLSITYSTGTALRQPFTVTSGSDVLLVTFEDKSTNLPEPATLTWNVQTLTRDVQTSAR